MIHLRSIGLREFPERLQQQFPFTLPIWQQFSPIQFTTPVTFLVGENGSGKSTLLEAIACSVGSITVGAESVKTDKTLASLRTFSQSMQLVWHARTKKGFFLRAEDFFGYIKKQAQIRAEMEAELKEIDETYKDRSDFAKGLAKMPYARELGDMKQRYEGRSLEYQSHGESFLALFQERFRPNGLYLLDEPEAPLSPIRQLGFLALLADMVKQNAQFIIVTHSPILMAFPGATIFDLDKRPLQATAWDELEHVTLTRDFLNNPKTYLHHLNK